MFSRFGTKLGILGGTIYYTNEIGIWGDSEQTTQLLEDITNFVKPYVSKNVPPITVQNFSDIFKNYIAFYFISL